MDGIDTELVLSEEAFRSMDCKWPIYANIPFGGQNHPPVSMQNLPPGANVTLRRVNPAGVADRELARLQFAQQINSISMTTGRPISVVEQLAETAHRTRVEEVEAIMSSHYSNEMRRIEIEATCTTSSYEARCLSEMSELRQSASRADIGNHENMVGQHYHVLA